MALVFGAADSPGRREQAQRSLLDLAAYLHDLLAHFRRHPAENLLTDLIGSQEADDRLSDDEIVATCTLVLFGGHETTTNLIGNGTRTLLNAPDQPARLVAEPELLTPAIEELLRFDGPSKMEVRRAAAEIEMRGSTINEGDQIYFIQAAANRDPEVFENPDTVDLGRSPNRHCGFGFGIHPRQRRRPGVRRDRGVGPLPRRPGDAADDVAADPARALGDRRGDRLADGGITC